MRLTPLLSNIAASPRDALCAAAVILIAGGAASSQGVTPDLSKIQVAQSGPGKNAAKSLDGKPIDIEEARRLFEQHQRELENVQREQQDWKAKRSPERGNNALQSRLIESAAKVQQSEKR